MDIITFIIFISILLFSVVLHEVAHGAVANALGDSTARLLGRLTLNPIAHLDPIGSFFVPLISYIAFGFPFGWAKPVPYNPSNFKRMRKWGDALVGFAGPATNILLAVIFGLALRLLVPFLDTNPHLWGAAFVFGVITFINLLLAVFNLVPIPPLDGSKLMYNIFSVPYQTRAFLDRNGFLFILLFIFFGFRLITPVIYGGFYLLTGTSIAALFGAL